MPHPFDLDLTDLAAPPAALEAMETAVLARIAATSPQAGGGIVGTLMIGAALAVGVGGGVLAGGTSPAIAAPIGVNGALAPSTLLLGR